MTIIDISPRLHSNTAVWPGDTPLTREELVTFRTGSNFDLSTLRATVHLGAHADAPSHYHPDGKSIADVGLEPYWGECYVTHVGVDRGGLIQPAHCDRAIKSGSRRLLFRTDSYPDPDAFNQDFVAFSAAAVELLGKSGVLLVGIDTPSVDPFESKDLPAHQMLYRYSLANVEGLVLAGVSEGRYEFVGLPLRLVGFDGSPLRAVLRPVN